MANMPVQSDKLPGRKSASTLRRIVDAAKLEFGTKGIDASTIKSVAARAGVSEQLIYHYYRCKEALFADASDALSAEVHEPYFRTDFGSMEPVESFRTFINLMFDLTVSSDSKFTSEEVNQSASHLRPGNRTVQYGTRLMTVLQDILDRGRDAGVFREGLDATLIYMSAFLLMPGFMSARVLASRYLQANFDSPQGVERWRHYSLDLLLRAVRC
jgi:TetR/AcrR family transcriptional regulator